jgi:hypothetical protein
MVCLDRRSRGWAAELGHWLVLETGWELGRIDRGHLSNDISQCIHEKEEMLELPSRSSKSGSESSSTVTGGADEIDGFVISFSPSTGVPPFSSDIAADL